VDHYPIHSIISAGMELRGRTGISISGIDVSFLSMHVGAEEVLESR
jgi:hypothetical protein